MIYCMVVAFSPAKIQTGASGLVNPVEGFAGR